MSRSFISSNNESTFTGMQRFVYIKRTRILRHGLFWLVVWLVFVYFHSYRIKDLPKTAPLAAVNVFSFIFCFYASSLYLIPRFLYNGKIVSFFCAYALLTFLGGSVNIFAEYLFIYPSIPPADRSVFWRPENLIYGSYLLLLLFVSSLLAIRFLNQWLQAQKKVYLLEKEKLNAELGILKAQIHPHFLFNTLNAVYFTLDEKNVKGRAIISNFSEILRYQLYECQVNRISIEREVNYLNHYITIEKIRRDDRYDIRFENDINESVEIAPLILLPFVENAFKHVSNHIEKANIVHIKTSLQGNQFCLWVYNTVSNHAVKPSDSRGVGIKNVKRRLELLYPEKYQLSLQSTATDFEVTLKIKVK